MNIRTKLSIPIIVLTVALATTVILVVNTISRRISEEEIFTHLETIAEIKKQQVETFLADNKSSIERLSKSFVVGRLLAAGTEDPMYQEYVDDVWRKLKAVNSGREYDNDIYVMDSNGAIVASIRGGTLGTNRDENPDFLYGKDGIFVEEGYVLSGDTMKAVVFSAPVLDGRNAALLGVVVEKIPINELNRILSGKSDLGKTGQIFLEDDEGRMVASSRFVGGALLDKEIETEHIRDGMRLVEQHGPVEPKHKVGLFRKHLGWNALRVHRQIIDVGWYLIVEIDEEEAFAPVARLTRIMLFLLVVFSSVIIVITIILVSRITKPLIMLQHGVNEVMLGNLNYRSGIEGNDEIERVSMAFDAMIEKLSKTVVSRGKLGEALEVTNTIIDRIPMGLVIVGRDKRIRRVNPAAVKMTGWDSENEVIGKICHNFICSADEGKCPVLDLKQNVNNSERVLFRKDGTEVPILKTVVPVVIDGEEVLLEVFLDITRQKRVEEELIEAREHALLASRTKTEFLANMSHEIRTPMNAIIGMADLLWETPLTSEQKQYVEIFKSAGDNLLNLINDILDLSKIEVGHVELEEIAFDLNDILERCCETLAPRAHEKNIELLHNIMPGVPTRLVGDPNRLRQIIFNLAGNAIKFTLKGEVVLKVENDPEDETPGSLLISVSDTGIGIPGGKLATIFDSFVQADASHTRDYGGTGLGLSISKKLVEIMGGKIRVRSELGYGSTFCFMVKLAVCDEIAERKSVSIDLKGVKVLAVDDNATNRLILRQMLTEWDAVVSEAENGVQALARLREAQAKGDPYAIVILDSRMPGMSGFDLAERIKDDSALAEIMIMMLTSDRRKGDISRCEELGVVSYLIKPVKRSILLETIQEAMGRRKAAIGEGGTADKPAAQDRHALKILLVDDSEDNRFLVQAYLKKTSNEVDVAENGKIAFERFKSNRYDLVLMDMQMPVMDGYESTRKIREWEESEGLEATPVIALTAYALKEETQKSYDAGCNYHLSKPVKKAKLLETISKHAGSVESWESIKATE